MCSFCPNSDGKYFAWDDMIAYEVGKTYKELSEVSEEEEAYFIEIPQPSSCLEEVQEESIYKQVTSPATLTDSKRRSRLTS